jgi:hypothetical protein
MKRARADQGRSTHPPTDEPGEVQSAYETSTGELTIRVQVGEMSLEVTLDPRATREYLHSSSLLYSMM